MIHIRVKGTPDEIEGFIVWGHAGQASYGKDIVCAGVTAICQTTIIGMEYLAPAYVWTGIAEQGLLFCRLQRDIPEAEMMLVQLQFRIMIFGLLAICTNYGSFIDLELPEF